MVGKRLGVWLSESEMRRFERQAKRKTLSKSALVRQWIAERAASAMNDLAESDTPASEDLAKWEKGNLGNTRLRINL